MASRDSSMAPSSEASASRLWGGTRPTGVRAADRPPLPDVRNGAPGAWSSPRGGSSGSGASSGIGNSGKAMSAGPGASPVVSKSPSGGDALISTIHPRFRPRREHARMTLWGARGKNPPVHPQPTTCGVDNTARSVECPPTGPESRSEPPGIQLPGGSVEFGLRPRPAPRRSPEPPPLRGVRS